MEFYTMKKQCVDEIVLPSSLLIQVYTSGGDPDSVAGEFGRHPLYKMLGYFSLIGLLRLHSLLGDYYQAIKVNIACISSFSFKLVYCSDSML